jgi:tetratricopeptide (TPR) repeat protein
MLPLARILPVALAAPAVLGTKSAPRQAARQSDDRFAAEQHLLLPLRKQADSSHSHVQTAQDRPRPAAQQLMAEGDSLLAQGTAESSRLALAKYEAALALWQALNDAPGAVMALEKMASAYAAQGAYRKALQYLERALPLSREIADRLLEADILSNAASYHSELGEVQKAIPYFEQALAILQPTGDQRRLATLLSNLGTNWAYAGDKRKALDYFEQALRLRQAVGDKNGEAHTLNNIGDTYRELGEKRRAIEYFQRALRILKSVTNLRLESIVANNLASTHQDLGEFQLAMDLYRRALALSRQVGDKRESAIQLVNLATLYDELGDTEQRGFYLHDALTLARALADDNLEAHILYSLGAVALKSGRPQAALEDYRRAREIWLRLDNQLWAKWALRGLGGAYRRLKDYARALDCYAQALAQIRSAELRSEEAEVLAYLGNVYEDMGAAAQAADAYGQALAVSRAIEYRDQEAEALFFLARLERNRDNLELARQYIESAIEIIESLRADPSNQDLRASFVALKQDYYEHYIDILIDLQQKAAAGSGTGEYAALALRISERARARSLLETLAEARADIRRGADGALLEQEYSLQKALNAKAARRQALLDEARQEQQLAELHREINELQQQLSEVRGKIRARNPQYAVLTQPAPLTLADIQQLLDDQTILLEYKLGEKRSLLWAVTPRSLQYYELPARAQIEAAARRLYELFKTAQAGARQDDVSGPRQDTTPPLRSARARSRWYPAAVALSRMILGPVASQLGTKRLLIVGDGALQYIPFGALPAPTSKSEDGAMKEESAAWKASDDSAADSAAARERGPGNLSPRRRVLAPSLLRSSSSTLHPLIVDHEIIYLPSASVLAVLRQERQGGVVADRSIAVLADPVFSATDPRLMARRSDAGRRENGTGEATPRTAVALTKDASLERAARDAGLSSFQRLRFSRAESAAIIALAPTGQSLRALDFDASRATATSPDLGRYRFLHFATHGLLNTQHPELSGLVLSLVDRQGQPQDGFLRLHEIYNLKLGADLVVLSACQTALGKEIRGEGLVGLTRGFMYAGARRVVASLWRVDDRATAELMRRFYVGMLMKGQRPAAALRAAQVSMLREVRWSNPHYWAAFMLQGEWR